MDTSCKPNCEKAILTVNYPLGMKKIYVHYSWNRWTAAVWAMYKSMRSLLPFPAKKTHWIRQELEIRHCKLISM